MVKNRSCCFDSNKIQRQPRILPTDCLNYLFIQIVYHDGIREVLDVRNHLSDWWLSCAWKHVPEEIRELCWKHATFRVKNFPRFARDCCNFVNKTTCFCFYLASDTCLNVPIVETCVQKQILPSSTGDGTSANPYIL